MYGWTNWENHVSQYEDRYRETTNSDGTITHTPVEGEVISEGTPQDADHFNKMEDGITNAGELAALLALTINQLERNIADLSGEKINVKLTNIMDYPFNSPAKTVALDIARNHKDYTIDYDIVSKTGGFVGDIEISDKLLNGFKIAHTGSAREVELNIYVKGGFY